MGKYDLGDLVSMPQVSHNSDNVYRVIKVLEGHDFGEHNTVVLGEDAGSDMYQITRVYGDPLDPIEDSKGRCLVPESWLGPPRSALIALALQAEDE